MGVCVLLEVIHKKVFNSQAAIRKEPGSEDAVLWVTKHNPLYALWRTEGCAREINPFLAGVV